VEVFQHTCYPRRPLQHKLKKCWGDCDLACAPPGIKPVLKFEESQFRHPGIISESALGGPRLVPSTQPRRGNHESWQPHGMGKPRSQTHTLSLNIRRPWLYFFDSGAAFVVCGPL